LYFNGLLKKGIIILFYRIIQSNIYFSYIESARQLEHETNLDVSKYDVCDNIDLDTILQEYELVFLKTTKNKHLYVFFFFF
jgi:katanin p60 ATPase-containing subunit A1